MAEKRRQPVDEAHGLQEIQVAGDGGRRPTHRVRRLLIVRPRAAIARPLSRERSDPSPGEASNGPFPLSSDPRHPRHPRFDSAMGLDRGWLGGHG